MNIHHKNMKNESNFDRIANKNQLIHNILPIFHF
jgi:hypothetical protein